MIEIKADVIETYPAYDIEIIVNGKPYFICAAGDDLYGMDDIPYTVRMLHAGDICDAVEKAIEEYVDVEFCGE